jgi:hypothetical protein
MKRRYYLAYGSNLNIKQMQMRCPTAKPVDSALLEDYELVFRGCQGYAVATIEPKAGSSVPCAIWLITPEDELSLDHYEGYPHLYRKEMLLAKCGEYTMGAMAYVMNDGSAIGSPSKVYLHTIRDGYRDFGLDTAELDAAVKKSRLR